MLWNKPRQKLPPGNKKGPITKDQDLCKSNTIRNISELEVDIHIHLTKVPLILITILK